MKSPGHLFADTTALLEDLHGVAVEGQHPDITPDMHAALASHLRLGCRRLERILVDVARSLGSPTR